MSSLALLGLLVIVGVALLPGGAARPSAVSADYNCSSIGRLNVRVIDDTSGTEIPGFSVVVSPNPTGPQFGGSLTLVDGSAADRNTTPGRVGVDACTTTGDSTYLINQIGLPSGVDCFPVPGQSAITSALTSNGAALTLHVQDCTGIGTMTPTPTQTPVPHLEAEKKQRLNAGGQFTTGDLAVGSGSVIEYLVSAVNAGTGNLTQVSIADAAPANTTAVTHVFETGPGQKCGVAANLVSCTGITLGPGSSYSVIFAVTVGAVCPSVVSNSAQVDSAETQPLQTNAVQAQGIDCFDTDGDGYSDAQEQALGKDPNRYCAVMRADVNGDGAVTLADLSSAAARFLQPATGAAARFDQNRDGTITLADLSTMASHFLQAVGGCD